MCEIFVRNGITVQKTCSGPNCPQKTQTPPSR